MSSVKFYCFSPMEKAIVHTYSGNVDPAFPLLNAKNFNRNTYTKGSLTAGTFGGSYDLGSNLVVDAMILHIRNYKVSDQTPIDRYYSNDGTTWTFISGSTALIDTAQPLRITEAGLTAIGAKRYWRYNLGASSSGVIQSLVSVIGLARLFTLPTIHETGFDEGLPYFGEESQAKDGGIHFQLAGRRPVREFTRTYLIASDANLLIMQNVWKHSLGMAMPVVMVEDNGVVQPPIMVKFASKFRWKRISAQYYRIDCDFIEVPYIDSGESF